MTEIAQNPVYLHPGVQAQALGAALDQLGFTTEVWKSRDFLCHPCIVIRCGQQRHVRQVEYVYAAPEINGERRWWFWRASSDDAATMEMIAPISQVSATADLLARALPQIRELNNGG